MEQDAVIDHPTAPAVGPDGYDEAVAAVDEPSVVGPDEAPPSRGERIAALALGLLVVLPVLVAGISRLGDVWHPGDDWAIIALNTHDVGTRHTPLVGVYSRYAWNHPGPLLFWLYAIPYRLSGGNFASLMAAAAAINAGAVAGMLALAWRRGRLLAMAPVAIVLALLLRTFGTDLVRDPWNPWVTVLPFGLLVLATWAASDGDTWGLAVVAGAGSVLAQAHVGFVPLAGLLGVVAVIGFWRVRHDRRPLVIFAVVLAAAWSPVLLDALLGGENWQRLLDYFVEGNGEGGETAGLGYSLELAALEIGGWGPWLGRREIANAVGGGILPENGGNILAAVAPFVLGGVLAWRDRKRPHTPLRFLVVVLIAVAGCILSVSRISGPVFAYLVRWWWPVAALWWAAAGWALLTFVAANGPESVRRRLPAVAATVAVVVAALVSVQTMTDPAEQLDSPDLARAQATLQQLEDEALPQLPTDRQVLYRWVGPFVRWAGDGFALQVAASGRDLRIDGDGTNVQKFGGHRVVDQSQPGAVAWVVSGHWVDVFAEQGKGRELTRWDPLTPAERERARELFGSFRTRLLEADRQDLIEVLDGGASIWPIAKAELPGFEQAEIDELERLQLKGHPVAVFLVDDLDDGELPEIPGGPTD